MCHQISFCGRGFEREFDPLGAGLGDLVNTWGDARVCWEALAAYYAAKGGSAVWTGL
jgi:hypothetical protein